MIKIHPLRAFRWFRIHAPHPKKTCPYNAHHPHNPRFGSNFLLSENGGVSPFCLETTWRKWWQDWTNQPSRHLPGDHHFYDDPGDQKQKNMGLKKEKNSCLNSYHVKKNNIKEIYIYIDIVYTVINNFPRRFSSSRWFSWPSHTVIAGSGRHVLRAAWGSRSLELRRRFPKKSGGTCGICWCFVCWYVFDDFFGHELQ